MSKFWIFLGILFTIVFIIAVGCAVSPDAFRPWLIESMTYIFGTTVLTVDAWWITVAANPVYQQWHMLIWFAGGIVGTVIFAKILWPRRPRIRPKAVTPSSLGSSINLQREPAEPEPAPRPIAKPVQAPPAPVKPEEPAQPAA